MNKWIIVTVFSIASVSLLLLISGSLSYELRDFAEVSLFGFLLIGAQMIWKIYFSKTNEGKEGLSLEVLSVPLRAVSFVIILGFLIYPAFFLEKGYFSNSLISSIDLLRIEQLNFKSDINVKEQEKETKSNEIKSTSNDDIELINKLRSQLKEINTKLHENKNMVGLSEQRLSNLNNRLTSLKDESHYENLFFVIRALTLGALGAMLTLLASSSIKSRMLRNYNTIFHDGAYWSLLITNCFAGAIVSVVVFALFYTKQITIYPVEGSDTMTSPDFWRTTLLCLISGAFAERIYEGVSTKVDTYIENSNGQPNNSSQKDADKTDASA